MGFLLSLSWYLVNKGSKYWQKNWERHVDVLEDEIIGPLYKTTLEGSKFFDAIWPHKAYQFSVSRVNQLISFFITVIWLGLMIDAFPYGPFFLKNRLPTDIKYYLLLGTIVFFAGLLIWLSLPKETKKIDVAFNKHNFEKIPPKNE